MDQEKADSSPGSVPTLKDVSVIPAAYYLCHKINIQNHVREFLDKHHPVWRTKKPVKKYKKFIAGKYLANLLKQISSKFSKELNRQGLPSVLTPKVHDKALEIAERIHDWMLHLTCDLNLSSKYMQKIYITANGEIDQDKIFKSHWMNFPLDKPTERSLLDKRITMLYYLACAFFQEEFIVTNKAKIVEEINSVNPGEENDDTVFGIMEFLIRKWANAYSIKIVSIPHMPCLTLGFYKPFRYFWNELEDFMKLSLLQFSITLIFSKQVELFLKVYYVAENVLKITTFLIDQVNSNEKDQTIGKHKYHLRYTNRKMKSMEKFSIGIIDRYLSFLPELEMEYFLKNIFSNIKIPVLKSVIDHQIFKNRKDYVFNFGRNRYKELISLNDFQLLNEFMDTVLKTQNEKNYFKKEFNFLNHWISNEKWDVMDNVLNWMSTLNKTEKRIIIMEQLKHPLNIKTLLKQKLIEKFLKWFCGGTEPLIDNYSTDTSEILDLTREIICKLWLRHYTLSNIHPLVAISSEVLKLVSGEIKLIRNFKKTELAKDGVGLVKLYCEEKLEMNMDEEAIFSVIDEFLKFCGASGKIDQVKTLIKDDIGDWIVKYGVALQRFDIIVPLLDWVYGSENDNRKLLKIYFENFENLENYYKSREFKQ